MMEINFSEPNNFDIKSLKKLWLSSFDEEPKAVDLFFDKCFDAKQTYIAKYTISTLYLISPSFNGQKAHLCGASTHKDFFASKHISKLIKYALEDSAKKRR